MRISDWSADVCSSDLLVFRAIGRPVGIIGGHHVSLGRRVMEGGVDHAGCHPVGDHGTQAGFAGAALDAHPVAIAHAALFGVLRSEERRRGKEWVSTCRSRWASYH